MVRIAIFNLKEVLKFIFKLLILLISLCFLFKCFRVNKIYMSVDMFDKLLCSNIFVDKSIDKNEKKLSFLSNILKKEYSIDNVLIPIKKDKVLDENLNINDEKNKFDIDNIDDKIYNITYKLNKNKIKNNTSYDINYDELLNKKINLNKNTTILIIHTHGSESYSDIEHTDYYRNEDITKNVVNVGTKLANILKTSGYNVIHDTNLYDYPTYSGSYTRALESINKYKNEDSNIDIVIDIHRDAISSDEKFAPTCNINGDEVSKLLLIIGTDGGGLEHNNFKENLSFGLKLYSAGEQMYPNIFRQLTITNSRYNQHATYGSILLEVGATGNTMEQCLNSAKYFAKILDEVLNEE